MKGVIPRLLISLRAILFSLPHGPAMLQGKPH